LAKELRRRISISRSDFSTIRSAVAKSASISGEMDINPLMSSLSASAAASGEP
jgi:hypothetical protein